MAPDEPGQVVNVAARLVESANRWPDAPAVIVPNGFQERESRIEDAGPSSLKHRVPVSLTFIGAHFGEDRLLAMAHAYQKVTRFHLEHPSLQ